MFYHVHMHFVTHEPIWHILGDCRGHRKLCFLSIHVHSAWLPPLKMISLPTLQKLEKKKLEVYIG
jgi:hypothetical protein